jgi:hypothetical protein
MNNPRKLDGPGILILIGTVGTVLAFVALGFLFVGPK